MSAKYDPTTYDLYVALFHARQRSPETWSYGACTRVLTAIMAATRWSWRVVGITPAAMEMFATFEFRYKPKQALTRAHIRPRFETVREVMGGDKPLEVESFLQTWVGNDRTVICAKGENGRNLPPYIEIENDDAGLFNCEGLLTGWRHSQVEVEFLRDLYSRKGSWRMHEQAVATPADEAPDAPTMP